jgi:hypothetical protein
MSDLTRPYSLAEITGRRGDPPMDHEPATQSLNPTSLTLADAARLLTKVGGQSVTVEVLQADLAAGAPANADGTINLVHYAAWLVQEMARHDRSA